MIITVPFNNFRGYPSIEQNDCVVLRRPNYPTGMHIEIAFPFHEDTPNFTLTVPEALTIRNAIDDLVAVKMLGEPEPRYCVASDWAPSNINIPDAARIRGLLDDYQLQSDYDAGARQAIQRIIGILKLKEDK
ncbi:hypothetical protein PV433_27185 [Paenibacillus sp. GYB004]|uniref:hypothetical protein n=1 Tax=Paenibacillus sp. GYB004 TaxID=2994393 RepID=UPI002F96C2FD